MLVVSYLQRMQCRRLVSTAFHLVIHEFCFAHALHPNLKQINAGIKWVSF